MQHYAFCRRQWALIHIEGQWKENLRTMDGHFFHEKAHDAEFREKRGDKLIVRELSVVSRTLGLSGQCDVVEFIKDPNGIEINGEIGCWKPYPVEYKKGAPKENNADILQLCAQAMCLEEMLCCDIQKGALFYGETKRRLEVEFDEELRNLVKQLTEEMHRLYKRGYTPKVKASKSCNACSMKDVCLPTIMKKDNSSNYLRNALEDEI